MDNGLRHPNGCKKVQVANSHFDWTSSPYLLSFVFAHTTRAQAPTALPPVAAMSHKGSPELPRRVVDKVLGNLQHLPDSWPLMRFDLILHKSESFYAFWRRFLHLNEYLRNNLTPDTANATIDAHARGLTEHVVQFLAEWILMALEPARAITKARAPDFLFLHEKDFWFKQIWVDLYQTMALDRQRSYTRPVLGLVRSRRTSSTSLALALSFFRLFMVLLHSEVTMSCQRGFLYDVACFQKRLR